MFVWYYCEITILYKPMTKSMRRGTFRTPQLRNRLIGFDKIRTLELPTEDQNFISIPLCIFKFSLE